MDHYFESQNIWRHESKYWQYIRLIITSIINKKYESYHITHNLTHGLINLFFLFRCGHCQQLAPEVINFFVKWLKGNKIKNKKDFPTLLATENFLMWHVLWSIYSMKKLRPYWVAMILQSFWPKLMEMMQQTDNSDRSLTSKVSPPSLLWKMEERKFKNITALPTLMG